jgi:hypothetical protein
LLGDLGTVVSVPSLAQRRDSCALGEGRRGLEFARSTSKALEMDMVLPVLECGRKAPCNPLLWSGVNLAAHATPQPRRPVTHPRRSLDVVENNIPRRKKKVLIGKFWLMSNFNSCCI